MKLRVTLETARDTTLDVTIECDVTATVADTARTLIRAGACRDPRLVEIAKHRTAPVTLCGAPSAGAEPVLLDPGSTVGESGLQSGWIVEAVAEFGSRHGTRRLIDAAGFAEVLSGLQTGVIFSLITGDNLIGRDRGSRVHLRDSSVSRRHAVVEIGDDIVLKDLGSSNGLIVDGTAVFEHRVTAPCTVELGDVTLRLTPGPPGASAPLFSHRVMHTRSPRVGPRFPVNERELPSPPAPATPSRIPMLAMLAPMMLGGAMYALTRSPMSLMMIAFSPLMMIGAWLDGRLSSRRRSRVELEQFTETLDAEEAELAEARTREIEVRGAETPTLAQIADAIRARGSLLWSRRPEHSTFLEIRFGEGSLPSRTRLKLPPRGETRREQWERLSRIETAYDEVAPVPVLERFDRCGSIGIAGEPHWANGLARSLVLQLAGLHSPAEVVLAAFANPTRAPDWDWLKWLPHIDTVTSPIPAWQLADDPASATRLLIALEGLLEERRANSRRTVRSHLDAETRNDDAQGDAVQELPTTPAVVVLVLDDTGVDPSRLIALAEEGPDAGIHLVWLAHETALLPAACRTFIELGRAEGRANFVRSDASVPLHRLEFVEAPVALDLARCLAPVEDRGARVLDESDLPKTVNLRELHPVDLVGGQAPILRAWTNSGSLVSQWQPGAEREPVPLAAVIGQGPDGPAAIDLRVHGPHALVGGTTGAGKSEFLQTWIMSLAAEVSPDRLTFLLVDYKGGAAFAECVDLPHTVGLVTDLSPHLVRRALTSLRAELHHREELLAQHGAKDVATMERRSDAAAPPALVIVIDEFAALATEVPEFVDGVIDVAQRGRSLGLHLIMATQRPAGVIKDNLRANTNLRVALRMADESDSSDVIGVKDAAFFGAETPGRGAMKVGPGRIGHFQAGYLGGRAATPRTESHVEVRTLRFSEGPPWDIPPEPRAAPASDAPKPPRDIETLRDGIAEAARLAGLAPPRRPWLDELPDRLDLADIPVVAAPADAATVGLRDDPAAQAQQAIAIDLEEAGNIALFGAGGTGKTSALITLVSALSVETERAPVQVYVIDAAGGALDALNALPTVGAVARLNDTELVARVLRRALDTIEERGPRYGAVRANSLTAYREATGRAEEPRMILLLDGFSAFRQATEAVGGAESAFQMLNEIMMTGRAAGVHVVVTGDRPSAIPAAMASNLQQQYVFRLANEHDYGHLGVKSDILADAAAGRAVAAGDPREIQFALLGARADLAGQARELERLGAALEARGVQQVPEVANAPETVPLLALPPETGGLPVYGIDTRTFEPVGLPLAGLGVISGPPGSGQSTAVLACVEAHARRAEARGERFESVLLTFASGGLSEAREWAGIASGDEEVAALAASLTVALGGRPAARPSLIGGTIGAPIGVLGNSPIGAPAGTDGGASVAPPGSPSTPSPAGQRADDRTVAEPQSFPPPGARGVIVVERPAEAEGGAALPELVALAKAARRAKALVLFELEQGTGTAIWDLFSALRQPNWGFALQPDAGDTGSPFRETFGRVKRADFPPGRGFAVEAGRVTPVHVAFPARSPEAPSQDRQQREERNT